MSENKQNNSASSSFDLKDEDFYKKLQKLNSDLIIQQNDLMNRLITLEGNNSNILY